MCSRWLPAAVLCVTALTSVQIAADLLGVPLPGPWAPDPIDEAARVADFQADTGRRLAAGERVAADLAAGRLGLWEAAGVMAEINGPKPLILVGPECARCDGIGPDGYARHLIDMVANRVKDPGRREAAVRRLEAELVGSVPAVPRPR